MGEETVLTAEEQAAQTAEAEKVANLAEETPEQKAEREKAESEVAKPNNDALEKEAKEKQDAAWERIKRQRDDARRRIEELQAENERIKAAKELEEKKPTLEQFGGDEQKFNEAMIDHKVAVKVNQEVSRLQPPPRQPVSRLAESEQEAIAVFPDYEEATAKMAKLPVNDIVKSTILGDSDGAMIKYYLAKNPDVALDLMDMDERSTLIEIGKIRARMEIEKQSKKTPVQKRQPAAPINPEKGAGGSAAVDENKLSDEAYFALQRKKGLMPQ